MKMSNTLNRLNSKSVVSPTLLIWLTFVSLFGKCRAQDGDIGFTVPLIVMLAGCSMFCFCFWICFTAICYSHQQKKNNIQVLPPPNATTAQYTFNLQRQCDLDYPQSKPSAPVPLPEATLHQGDAPPAYEEAVGMKTVSHAVDLP